MFNKACLFDGKSIYATIDNGPRNNIDDHQRYADRETI